VTHLVDGQQLAEFVLSYEYTAFRLETREQYNEPEEDEPLRRFLVGEPDYSWNEEWATMMRQRTAAGKRMARVRIVSEPHGEYTRFGLDLARINVDAGEDIRYLPRARAIELDLPEHDFWLIDSSRLAILRFGDDDVLLGAEVSDDPTAIVQYGHWRDLAWHHAIPVRDYNR
jgi:hypothetical protein